METVRSKPCFLFCTGKTVEQRCKNRSFCPGNWANRCPLPRTPRKPRHWAPRSSAIVVPAGPFKAIRTIGIRAERFLVFLDSVGVEKQELKTVFAVDLTSFCNTQKLRTAGFLWPLHYNPDLLLWLSWRQKYRVQIPSESQSFDLQKCHGVLPPSVVITLLGSHLDCGDSRWQHQDDPRGPTGRRCVAYQLPGSYPCWAEWNCNLRQKTIKQIYADLFCLRRSHNMKYMKIYEDLKSPNWNQNTC